VDVRPAPVQRIVGHAHPRGVVVVLVAPDEVAQPELVLDRDDQHAFAICDSKNTGNEHQRKQTGYNEIATFDFLNERSPDEKETQRDEKLHCREATES